MNPLQILGILLIGCGVFSLLASGWSNAQMVSLQRDTIEHYKTTIAAHNRAFDFQQRTIHAQQETIDMLEAFVDAEDEALHSSPRLN